VGTALSLVIAAMIVAAAGLQLAHRLPDEKSKTIDNVESTSGEVSENVWKIHLS
jgi:hypothetical protein